MRRPAGDAVSDHDARPVDRGDEIFSRVSISNKKFCFALRGFVRIAEGLSGIDFRFLCEFFRSGDVRGADVMQTSRSSLLDEIENLLAFRPTFM